MHGPRTKRKSWAGLAVLCAACLVCLATACTDSLSGTGTLNIGFSISRTADSAHASQAGRAIIPDFASEVDHLTVTITQGSTSQTSDNLAAGDTASFPDICAGDWAVSAAAFNSSGVQIGTSTQTVTVSTGTTSSVVLAINYTSSYGSVTGTVDFALPITWPADTGVDWVALSVDAGTQSVLEVDTTSSATMYSAALSETLAYGAHKLQVSFKRGGENGTPAGTFIETVNIYAGIDSYYWYDNTGTKSSIWSFASTSFLNSNASLSNLSLNLDGNSWDIGFTSATTEYSLRIDSGSTLKLTPTQSVPGQYISYTWNNGSSTSLASASNSGNLPLSDANSLSITVRAPDGASTKTYTISIIRVGSATLTFDLNPAYQALSFASSAINIATASGVLEITSTNSSLVATGENWKWYLDGVDTGSSSSATSYTLSLTEIGTHTVSCAVTYNGLRYSGTVTVTIYGGSGSPWYNGNGADSGFGPDDGTHGAGDSYTLWSNTGDGITAQAFVRSGYTFAGWNTKADGSGTSYAAGATISWPDSHDITFFAQWTNVAPAVPSGFSVAISPTSQYATLSWTDPGDGDLSYIGVTINGSATPYRIAKGVGSWVFAGLSPGTWTFTIKAYDKAGSASSGATYSTALLNSASIASTLSGTTNTTALAGSYVLNGDMTLSSFTPIGTSSSKFTGTFDGNGHTIYMTISSASNFQGLFAATAATATVKNLKIVANISGGNYTGAIAGTNYGSLIHCSSSGTIHGSEQIGGLVGSNLGTISQCYSTASVSASSTIAGGLVGFNGEAAIISNSYARGSVTSTYTSAANAGGFVGYDYNDTITNCYSTGLVSIATPSYVGGFAGRSTGTLTNCFYDTSTSGYSTSTGWMTFGTATSTALMKTASTFGTWDLSTTLGDTTIWGIDTTGTINNGYPYLQFFGVNTEVP